MRCLTVLWNKKYHIYAEYHNGKITPVLFGESDRALGEELAAGLRTLGISCHVREKRNVLLYIIIDGTTPPAMPA